MQQMMNMAMMGMMQRFMETGSSDTKKRGKKRRRVIKVHGSESESDETTDEERKVKRKDGELSSEGY